MATINGGNNSEMDLECETLLCEPTADKRNSETQPGSMLTTPGDEVHVGEVDLGWTSPRNCFTEFPDPWVIQQIANDVALVTQMNEEEARNDVHGLQSDPFDLDNLNYIDVYEIIDNGTVDVSPAVCGAIDLRKLRISYPTRRRDPANPHKWMVGQRLSYNHLTYHPKGINFYDQNDVDTLNKARVNVVQNMNRLIQTWDDKARNDLLNGVKVVREYGWQIEN